MSARFRLERARRAVTNGGLIAYPTEAVYGLGCDPLNRDAVARLLAVKRRPLRKGLIVLAADLDQLLPLLAPLDPQQIEKLEETWPGPVTWVLPANPATPFWLTGNRPDLAVRVTDHPLACELCAVCGPLVSTSANFSGHAPARTALQARLRLGTAVDVVVPGTVGGLARPTEIRDGRSGRVLRNS
ncbi:MAG: Sua5/YciO/YrdC/YwlC family protein [Aquisalimonadaceae bacterium]